jgi:hypothetical protein
LIEFENELHQAVEAGIHTYSGQTSWSLPNAFLYSFSVASTIGKSLTNFFVDNFRRGILSTERVEL